jgi:A/G-specific adenine glycosylase
VIPLSQSDKKRGKTVVRRLEPWFPVEGRSFPWRSSRASNYKKVVCEVLLQRTRAETVASIYTKFFNIFPNWEEISSSSISKIQDVIKPLGLWKRRARSLRELAREIQKLRGRFPKKRKLINELPSVGQYIGNSIELFVHKRPLPLIDVNMARVLERYFRPRRLADIRYDPWLQALASYMVTIGDDPIKLNWGLLDLGGTVCLPKTPRCKICPIRKGCSWFKGIN